MHDPLTEFYALCLTIMLSFHNSPYYSDDKITALLKTCTASVI